MSLERQHVSARLRARPVPTAAKGDGVGWCLSFISFTMLLLNQWAIMTGIPGLAMIVILMFLFPWVWIIVRRKDLALQHILSNWLLLMLPLLALMSTMWSDYPAVSARGATQFIATTVVGIVAGSCIKPRSLLSALLGALSLVAVFSVLYGGKTAIGLTGEIGLLGIFGSKNYFGLTISFLLLTSVIVWADRLQPRLFRLIGMAGALAAPLLLIQAKSTGAIVVSLTTGLLMLACYVGFRLLPQFRATLIIVGALCIVMFTIFGTLNIDESQDALGLFGKDVTLTGRTYLWEYAIRSVADNPALGVGYQAYWVPENLYAQELWRHAGVGPGGFHFHNTYLQVAVDLGLIGLFVLLATFTAIARRVVATIVGPRPSPEQLFAITAFIFMLLRTPIEVDLFFQFQLSTIFLCLCWIYLQPRARIARAAEVS